MTGGSFINEIKADKTDFTGIALKRKSPALGLSERRGQINLKDIFK